MENIKIDYRGDCEYCVICGTPIPEGGQICAYCLKMLENENDGFDY